MVLKNSYPGVRVRGASIEIEIRYKGRMFRPSLKLRPTASNLKIALSIKESIRRDITLGKLNISEYFDDSKILKYFGGQFSSRITVLELLDIWFEGFCKTNDYYPKEYKTYIENYIKPTIGRNKINDLTPKQVRDFQDKLSERISNKTINNVLISLRQSFLLAFSDEMIEYNIMDRVKNLKVKIIKVTPLDIEEIDVVLHSMASISDYFNFYQFAIWTGLSTGEQLGLKWTDVNFEDKIITINRMWCEYEIRPVKNPTRDRNLELIQTAVDALLAQKKLNYDSEWVFIDSNNKVHKNLPWSATRISKPWNKALKDNGLAHRRAYATRHTYSSIMLSAGMSLEWLKKKMGHSSYKMLEDVYASWTNVSSSERKRIREWVLGKSQDGHMPDMEKEFFTQ